MHGEGAWSGLNSCRATPRPPEVHVRVTSFPQASVFLSIKWAKIVTLMRRRR